MAKKKGGGKILRPAIGKIHSTENIVTKKKITGIFFMNITKQRINHQADTDQSP